MRQISLAVDAMFRLFGWLFVAACVALGPLVLIEPGSVGLYPDASLTARVVILSILWAGAWILLVATLHLQDSLWSGRMANYIFARPWLGGPLFWIFGGIALAIGWTIRRLFKTIRGKPVTLSRIF